MAWLSIEENKKVLVVAPHPDDESIGCGGLLSMYGAQIDVMLLTDGRKGHDDGVIDDEKCASIREQEIRQAMNLAGIHKLITLRIPDGRLNENLDQLRNMNISQYDYIFIPNRYESHKDHRATNRVFLSLFYKQCNKGQKLFEYEVWSPLCRANHVLRIDNYIEQKDELVRQYKSQLDLFDYISLYKGLNEYRGALNHCRYAEAYEQIARHPIAVKIYQMLPNSIKKLVH